MTHGVGAPDLRYVEHLARSNYEAIGFIPRPRLEQYAARGQVLMAQENNEDAGFLVFGNGRLALRIYQACIQYDARRHELGLLLVARLVKEAQRRGAHLISLWCADDLPANNFWRAAGFRCLATRAGGKARGRIHNEWVLAVATEQLPLWADAIAVAYAAGEST